jgi:hypothetical protein
VTLAFITMYAELERIICSGPRRGKQPTYALLTRRAPAAKRYTRDEALGELTTRYFRSHGPATVRDYAWWSGLTIADAKRGLSIAGARSVPVDGLTYWTLAARRPPPSLDTIHLLPVYDEYLVAYRDLAAVPRDKAFWGVLPQAIVCGGQVIGTWKVARAARTSKVAITLGRKLTAGARGRLDEAIARYSKFAAR